MGQNTKIDRCDASWNPVTGCYHGCEYCYARSIAKRFSCEGQTLDAPPELQRVWLMDGGADLRQKGCHVLRYPVRLLDSGRICPYPFAFASTLHRYKLDEPQKWTRPRTIFVCSMADLFGDWVPDSWIEDVFAACENAPQHRYLFLTKNPKRYSLLKKAGILPRETNVWYGTSTPRMNDAYAIGPNTFVSIEPILEPFTDIGEVNCGWVIVGAETGSRKNKIVPTKDWIMPIIDACYYEGVPIFMKESLREIMGDDFRQEFPWEVNSNETD